MRHVLSISLGSSSRDKTVTTTILGEEFELERRGTHGDLKLFGDLLEENDGKVDALTIGGADIGIHWNGHYYPFRDIERQVQRVKQTPVVDGSGLKNTLERETIRLLQEQGVVDFATAKVFLVCATDRFGMAEELAKVCPHLIFGDLMFNIGVPVPVRTLSAMNVIAAIALPILGRLPFKWIYPTGEKEDIIVPKYEKYYQWADLVAGDGLLVVHHLPERLDGKLVLTNTTTEKDVESLRSRGVSKLITSTPVLDGRSFGTNVMEGVFVTLLGKRPGEIQPQEYLDMAHKIGWAPAIRDLQAAAPKELT
jgi:hypothetical protein